MVETINYFQSFQLAKRFELYQLQKSWGIMVIVMGVSTVFMRIQWYLLEFIVKSLDLDRSTAFWIIFAPINYIIFIGLLLAPFVLALGSFRSVKRMTVKDNEISSKRYYLFGFTLLFFYLIPYWIRGPLEPLVYLVVFPSSFTIENGNVALYISPLQDDAVILLFTALSFLISSVLMGKILKNRRVNELLYPGLVTLFSFLTVIIIHQLVFQGATPSNSLNRLEDQIRWVILFIKGGCYFTSGYFSIIHAYQALEEKE